MRWRGLHRHLNLSIAQELKNDLLDLARIVAHGTERKNAPLATFIAGRFVEAKTDSAIGIDEALAEAIAIARSLLPEEEAST